MATVVSDVNTGGAPSEAPITSAPERKVLKSWAIPFFAGLFTLGATMASFLSTQGHSLLAADSLAAMGVLALISLLMAALYRVCSQPIRALLEAVLVMLVVDLNTAGVMWPLAAGGVVLAVLLLTKGSIIELLAVFGGFTLLATAVGAALFGHGWMHEINGGESPPIPAAVAKAAASRPAIVHIVFDEHAGIAGFPRDEAGQAAARETQQFYVDNGFTIFPRAYSKYMRTVNAIPDMLNFGTKLADEVGEEGMTVGPTRYFNRLNDLGYKTTIIQSDFGNLCSGAPRAHCIEYSSTSMAPIADTNTPLGDRVYLIFGKWVSLSETMLTLRGQYFRFFVKMNKTIDLPVPPELAKWTNSVASQHVLEGLVDDVSEIKPGEAIFVHALYPHYPYVANRDCSYKPFSDWGYRKDHTPIADREAAYFDQLGCLRKIISRYLSAIEASPAADNYVVILHGDHGSRIVDRDPQLGNEKTDPAIMRAIYSTLFAVKVSNAAGRVDYAEVPVTDLISKLAATEFKPLGVEKSVANPIVSIENADWHPIEKRALPSDW